MLITFVCNQNLARSQVLSSVFSKLYPEHEFQSAGLIAIEGNELPLVVQEIFQDWGLPLTSQKARNIFQHFDEIRKSDLVISVNEYISRDIQALGFNGKVVNLEEVAEQLGLKLRDPQLVSRGQCAYELAKYLKVAFTALQRMGYIKNHQTIKALIPERESSINNALELAFDKKNKGAIIIMEM